MASARSSKSMILIVCTFAAGFIIAFGGAAASAKEKVVYAFRGGDDGKTPFGTLISDGEGNLYGTTNLGGVGTCEFGGCGTVFKLAADGTESVLYAFTGGNDGAYPYAGLTPDGAGNYYGTTQEGGGCADDDACGTVFKLASDGTESVLYAFQGGSDGLNPVAGLIMDSGGNLYGTTAGGGNYDGTDCEDAGCGTVFEVTATGTKSTLYVFQGGIDGGQPVSGVISDDSGNLYGTTTLGGAGTLCGTGGCGTVFKITSTQAESVLYAFQGGSDGAVPYARLIADAGGNLYGTTAEGGDDCNCGTVFRLAPDGTEKVIYAFRGGNDGRTPESALIMDSAGNLYGTTFFGGSTGCRKNGCGTVFKVTPKGRETVLYAFGHGKYPVAGLLAGANDLLYGTTTKGGSGDGVVFSVKQ